MRETVTLAWRNMWRNWRRTIIALSAIVLGAILLLVMDGFLMGADQAIFGNAVRLYGGNLQVHASGYRAKASRLPLEPLADADAVVATARALPHVVAASKRINTGGLAISRGTSRPVTITGIEPTVEAPTSIIAENIGEGRFLMAEDGDAVLVGRGLADALGVATGDRIGVLGRAADDTMHERTLTIVGIYDLGMTEAEKLTLYVTLSEAQELYKLRDQVTEVSIFLDRVGREPAAMRSLEAALPDYEIDSWDTLRPEMRQAIDTKTVFASFFGIVVLFIAAIGILNVLLMAVFERTREMGVLAALGFKPRQLLALFLMEGVLIGFAGAVIGCALGGAVVWAVGRVGLDYSFASGMGEVTALMGNRLYPTVTLGRLLTRGVTVVVIAAIASLYPAWLASRRQPAEVLHHV